MARGFGTTIWLCWLFISFFPFVAGQIGGCGLEGCSLRPFRPGVGFGPPVGPFPSGGDFDGRPIGGGNNLEKFGQVSQISVVPILLDETITKGTVVRKHQSHN